MAVVQWNPCHRTFLTFCNICNDARDGKIRQDMTMWPAVDLFELCTVAVTCSYAHVLFLPQFSQETSELSFHRIVFPSFHPFPLFNLLSAGWPGGKQCVAPAVGPVNHSQHTSLFADDTWKTQRHQWGRRLHGERLNHEEGPKKKNSHEKSTKVIIYSLRRWRTLSSTRWCSHLVPFISFFCCHGSRSALPMRWRLFGVLVCCFQGPVLRQGAQLSLDHSQHRLQQVSHGQLS